MRTILTMNCVIAMSAGLWAQSPSFDVATIKANRTGSGSSNGPYLSNARLVAQNASLKHILEVAYGLSALEIVGPDWLDTERFDLAGKMPEGAAGSDFMPMLQTLLKERFRLRAHSQEREMPVYDLTVAKGGFKLTIFDPAHIPGPPPRNGAQSMIIGPMTMPQFAKALTGAAGRPVVDRTGLDGRYYCAVTFGPLGVDPKEEPVDIFAAVQQQLGLKLEANRALLRILVIDQIERSPSEN